MLPDLGNILIIGGGRMGSALLAGILNAGLAPAEAIIVAEPGEDRRAFLEAEYGIRCVADAKEAPVPDMCLLAVKPQVMRSVLDSLTSGREFAPKRVISIAAGITTSLLAEYFTKSSIVRAMPNTPLIVGSGMVAVSPGEGTPLEDAELACSIFSCMGDAIVVDESLQDSVVAISGSGPAYFALFVQELANAGVELGLDPDVALRLSLKTMSGTSALLEQTGQSPAELIEAVSSPGGTTIAALDAMREGGVAEAIDAGAKAASRRSKELS